MKVLVLNESVLESWAKDLVTFGCLFGLYYLNHRFLGNSSIVTATISLCLILGAINLGKKRALPAKEALKKVEEIVRKEQGKKV